MECRNNSCIDFIFAVIGMNLFNGIKFQKFLNSDANFDTFGNSFMTLFRCSTGESYNGIMHDVMISHHIVMKKPGIVVLRFSSNLLCRFLVLPKHIS